MNRRFVQHQSGFRSTLPVKVWHPWLFERQMVGEMLCLEI